MRADETHRIGEVAGSEIVAGHAENRTGRRLKGPRPICVSQ